MPAARGRSSRGAVRTVRPKGAGQPIEFRDVFEVDGKAGRDRQERLTRLFLNPAAGIEYRERPRNTIIRRSDLYVTAAP